MEETIRISDDAGRSQRDNLVQPGRGFNGKFVDLTLVDVGVRRRIPFQQFRMTDDFDGGGGAGDGKRQVERDWYGRAHIDVTFQRLEALSLNGEAIRGRRQIAE